VAPAGETFKQFILRSKGKTGRGGGGRIRSVEIRTTSLPNRGQTNSLKNFYSRESLLESRWYGELHESPKKKTSKDLNTITWCLGLPPYLK